MSTAGSSLRDQVDASAPDHELAPSEMKDLGHEEADDLSPQHAEDDDSALSETYPLCSAYFPTATATQRILSVRTSKIHSNVFTRSELKRATSDERIWRAVGHLEEIGNWQKLLEFSEPILMNFKIIELKSSFVSMLHRTSDFATWSFLLGVLAKITKSRFEAYKTELFKELTTPEIMRKLYRIVYECSENRPEPADLNRFMMNIAEIYTDIVIKLGAVISRGFMAHLKGLIEACLCLMEADGRSSCADPMNNLLLIINSSGSLVRDNSIFPLSVNEESVEIRVLDGPFSSVQQYQAVLQNLMKEDFQHSLKNGISAVQGSTTTSAEHHLNLFENVTLSYCLTEYSVKNVIIFEDPETIMAKIRGAPGEHFKPGSILMLSNSKFSHYCLVRIESSSLFERRHNYIYVSMVEGFLGPPCGSQYIHFGLMAEPSHLFEPYHRVINVIRSFDRGNLPFSRYIVHSETVVRPPKYAKPDAKLKVDGYTCSLWENETWPTPESVGLNAVQLDGLKHALRSEVAIIQGPPGTGKTHLSRKIINVLLQNKPLWNGDSDEGAGLIMVVSFKNNSLDELLAGLVNDDVKVLRVGTNSKEESLDEYNLKSLEEPRFSDTYETMSLILNSERRETVADLESTLNVMYEIDAHSGIVKFEYFSSVLRVSEDNFRYLNANFEEWLLPNAPNDPPFRYIEHVVERTTGHPNSLGERSTLYRITLEDTQRIMDIVGYLDEHDCWGYGFIRILRSATNCYNILREKLPFLNCPLTSSERLAVIQLRCLPQYPLELLPLEGRWLLYKTWLFELRDLHHKRVVSLYVQSQAFSQQQREIDEFVDIKQISHSDAQVIGLTTTAAAKHFNMMNCLKPKIVLVDEAAEVMEAHTVAALTKYCEHLILVGDHKQLRAQTISRVIGEEARLEHSLFERLVRNGVQPCTLNTQYRMRPEIANLIRPAVYQELLDHPSVVDYPKVLGVGASVYFVDHTIQEDMTQDVIHRWNRHEAEFHLALCYYLLMQGYEPDQITILVTYSEQAKYLIRKTRNSERLREVVTATVDSFQGKESDIILLSLVRSNMEAAIGFVAQENRINVALSRAKIGLFIIGNKSNLLAREGLWTRVIGVLQKKKAIGPALPLKCEVHGRITRVTKPADFKILKNGGCSRTCGARLPCGHNCKHFCHPLDRQHNDVYKCTIPCEKLMKCSHRCSLMCHSTKTLASNCYCRRCSKCDASLSCGHTCQLMGHGEYTSHQCHSTCGYMLRCGHRCSLLCHDFALDHMNCFLCSYLFY